MRSVSVESEIPQSRLDSREIELSDNPIRIKGEILLDLFMGNGTTNPKASLLGRHSIGIDVDPFSRFIASAKTTVLPGNELPSSWFSLRGRVNVNCFREDINRINDSHFRN